MMNSSKLFFFLNIAIVFLIVIIGVALAWTNPTGNPPSGSGSGFVKFLTTPVSKINWTAATGWTDVDISSDTGTDTAKAAILAVQLSVSRPISGAGGRYIEGLGKFRKNGMSETDMLPRISGSSDYGASSVQIYIRGAAAGVIIVELDNSEKFEATFVDTGPIAFSTASFKVDLIGYILQ